jgi:hypothetical protein
MLDTSGPRNLGPLGARLLLAPMWAVMAGCLRPPSPPPSDARGGQGPASEVDAGAAVAVVLGKRLVLWDGEHIKPRNVGVGRGAHFDFWDGGKGWASCDDKPSCVATLAPAPNGGVHGHKGLRFHGEGRGWIGAGWNWFGWYRSTAGNDLSPYENLTFQIRVDAPSPAASPDPAAVTIALGCSRERRTSARVSVEAYDLGFADGAWHRIRIPMADLTRGPQGVGFDLGTVWELQVSTSSASPRSFDIYVDQIAAEER